MINEVVEPADLSIEQKLTFLERTAPFSELDRVGREKLVARAQAVHYPAGSTILSAGRSEITHLGLIVSGQVKLFLVDQDGIEKVFAYRDPGQAIGALGILRESLSSLDVVAVADTVLLLLARDDFQELIQTNARFSQFYLKVMSEGYVGTALSQLRRSRPGHGGAEGSLFLFSAQVGDVVRRRPVTVPWKQSIQKAAVTMTESRVGSLLITNGDDQIVGIITDRDLRRVVAEGRDFTTPVHTIMASPIRTISSHMVCFDAMLEMMRRRVHHLVMEKNGSIEGVLSGHDLMVLQGSSPLYLMREISAATKLPELYDLALASPRIVHSLILEGARPNNITRMITLINDHLLDRLLTLISEEMGPPPVPFCWLLMGSEGRQEQTYKTDQDNGLIYADPANETQAKAAELYFKAFGNEASRHLVACGFPRCPGDIMASNPKWCQPLSVWKGYFDHWINTPKPEDVLNSTIFFDFRPGWGTLELGQELRRHLMDKVSNQSIFLRFLARDCLTTPAAIGFFRKFVLEKNGEHKNKLDLKHKGLVPIVDFARILSLRSRIPETNTMERLQLLGEGGFISREMYQKTSQSYEIQMALRLLHQDGQWEEGLAPDNYIDPYELSEIERNNLREALNVVGDIRSYLKEEYQLGSA